MKLQQLRYIVEVARQGMNISEAAEALFTSQPGVSKQIRLLEEELGVQIFERSGKRLTGLTEPGGAIIDLAGRIVLEAENLKRLSRDHAQGQSGMLALAASLTPSRALLPAAAKAFLMRYADVELSVRQGSTAQVADWVAAGEADIGIVCDMPELGSADILGLPIGQWHYSVVAPKAHPIHQSPSLTLHELARWPLVLQTESPACHARFERAFSRLEKAPRVLLRMPDSEAVKTCVRQGLGVGVIADMAYDPERDSDLGRIAVEHFFEAGTSRILLRRRALLRRFEYDFIERFIPHLNREAIQKILAGQAGQSWQL
jgi:LysR family cys regulon transcriptional activator